MSTYQCYNVTMLQCYNVTNFSFTIFPYCINYV